MEKEGRGWNSRPSLVIDIRESNDIAKRGVMKLAPYSLSQPLSALFHFIIADGHQLSSGSSRDHLDQVE